MCENSLLNYCAHHYHPTINNAPAGSTYITSFTITNADSDKWFEADVSDFVAAQADKKVSFFLVNEGSASATSTVSFFSNDATENRPMLVIESGYYPVDDAFVQGGTNANTNYGTNFQLIVKKSTSANTERRSYLKFDFGSFNGNVASAKLRLYTYLVDRMTICCCRRITLSGV